MRHRRLQLAASIAAALLLASCGGGDGPAGPEPVASVLLSRDTATVRVGDTLRVTAVARDASGATLAGRAFTWSSSNQAAATVTDGLVRGVGGGTAMIIASAEGRADTLRLTVHAPVGSVQLSADSIVLTPGETRQLTVTLRDVSGTQTSGRVVAWRSTDTAIATVSGTGLVSGGAVGTASIIVTSEGKADTALVRVREVVEARALWVNRFEYNSATKIAEIMDKAAAANFNIVYFQVRGQADAYYVSNLEPCAISLCGSLGNGFPSWDPLAVAVQEAHSRGLQLHAWLNALTGFSSPTTNNSTYCSLLVASKQGAPNHVLIDHPERAMVNSSGVRQTCTNSTAVEYVYLSPGIPAVRSRLAAVAADIARRYAVDGIHLDRIRYPGTAWSYDSASLAAFTARYGRAPSTTTSDPQWDDFRRELVNLTVRETADSLRVVNPALVLSASVWGIHTDKWGWGSSQGFSQYLQDPPAWAAGGYLDVSVPMTYWRINDTYCSYVSGNPDWACLLDDHMQQIQQTTGRHVYVGIAANKGATEVVRQIRLGRERGVAGFSIYSYNSVESAGLWSVLRDQVFTTRATVPPMPWK